MQSFTLHPGNIDVLAYSYSFISKVLKTLLHDDLQAANDPMAPVKGWMHYPGNINGNHIVESHPKSN